MHIGIIPDGNRTFAREHNLSLNESYVKGVATAHEIIRAALDRGDVKTLVFYVLSKENYKERKRIEIEGVFAGIREGLKMANEFPNVSIQCVGDSGPAEVQALFKTATGRQKKDQVMTVYFLLHYSPTWDFEERPIRSSMIPDLDLVIRTGPTRLSGFLPLQSAQAQFYFPHMHWPEFSPDVFNTIIEEHKKTRLGAVPGK